MAVVAWQRNATDAPSSLACRPLYVPPPPSDVQLGSAVDHAGVPVPVDEKPSRVAPPAVHSAAKVSTGLLDAPSTCRALSTRYAAPAVGMYCQASAPVASKTSTNSGGFSEEPTEKVAALGSAPCSDTPTPS